MSEFPQVGDTTQRNLWGTMLRDFFSPYFNLATGVFNRIFNNIYSISYYNNDLTAAITAIGSTQATLIIDANCTISSATVVPKTLSIICENPGRITKIAGTLTINGPFKAGLYQVFSGFASGEVTFGSTGLKEVHPEWWGAKADNSTDGYSAIVSANNSLPAGGSVCFANGTYLSNTRGIIIPSNIRWSGAGPSSIVKANSATAGHFIATQGTDILVENMTLDGNGAMVPGAYPTAGSTIELDGITTTTARVTIKNCVLKRNRFATIGSVNASHVSILDNTIIDAEDSAIAFVDGSQNLIIRGNRILNGGKFGISLDNADVYGVFPDKVNTAVISENYIYINAGNSSSGMDIQNCRAVVVSNNEIVLDGGSATGIKVHTTASDINVTNNVIRFSANATTNTGIEVNGSAAGTKNENVYVTGNVLSTIGTAAGVGTGILFYAHSGNAFDNMISNLSVGIQVQSLGEALVYRIANNTVRDSAAINFNLSGSTGSSSIVYMVDNISSGAGVYDYVLDSKYIVCIEQDKSQNVISGSVTGPLYSSDFFGIAAPVAGTWYAGMRMVNSAPTAGQPKAWTCTVTGTPGTWVSEGNL